MRKINDIKYNEICGLKTYESIFGVLIYKFINK